MWDCRLLIILLAGLLLGSCNPAKRIVAFDESKIDAQLFQNIFNGADSIILYKTSFTEHYVENRKTGVLEFCVLSEQERNKSFKYLNMKGDSQDIYLVRFMQNRSSLFIYMSVKYGTFPDKDMRPVTHCKGFGPAYAGIEDPFLNVINLGKAVRVNSNGSMNYKSGKNPKPVFIPAEPISDVSRNTIRIKQIMFGEYNKFGGRRPVIMPMNTVFTDKNMECLNFRYVKTLNTH
ncbi:MAG: hypothetical protein JWQ38_2153 [Flavipsychrobacter sp.]|nr:hypothetical protein [Flavipsychrobacter sp.]